MDELVIDGKTYISSKHAAKITGYAKDYVGQLCREGRVQARLVGRNWYVLEDAIRQHRFGEGGSTPGVVSEKIPQERPVTDTWEPIVYHAEPQTPVMPQMPAEKAPLNPTEDPKPQNTERIVSDMQSAWREWYEAREAPIPATVTPVPVEEPVTAPEPQTELEDTAIEVTLRREEDEQEQEPLVDRSEEESSDISNDEAIFGGSVVPRTTTVGAVIERQESMPKPSSQFVRSQPHVTVLTDLRKQKAGVVDLTSTPTVRSLGTPPSFAPVLQSSASQESTEETLREVIRPVVRSDKGRGSSGAITKALLISIAGIAITVMLVGSGLTEDVVPTANKEERIDNPFVDLFQGETIYKKDSK